MRHDIVIAGVYLLAILIFGVFTILDISSLSNIIQNSGSAIILGTVIRICIESIILVVCIKKVSKYILRIKGGVK